ncbi:MAG: zinc ABC transporter substrate-binding protein [Helicobacteraceae bacterium]|nr:zinc ABC transporter substrate-binding protein [Helicobacteraceae bacterium]
MIKIFVSLLFFVCGIFASDRINVSVSVIPQSYFVKQIAGDLVDVNVMVQKGKSPETYEPAIKQLQELSKSRIYFGIGMPFEDAWLDRFQSVNPDMLIVKPLQDGILDEYNKKYNINHNESHHDHDHHDHNHPPHIWLSFELSKLHAKKIADTLISINPKNTQIYKENLEKFINKIDNLYNRFKIIFADSKKSFLVFHPAWNYIANELGLTEYAIQEDGKEAKIAHTRDILEIIEENNIKVMLIQPQFSQKNALTIAKEAGIEVKLADPLSYDWLNNLESFLNEIANN